MSYDQNGIGIDEEWRSQADKETHQTAGRSGASAGNTSSLQRWGVQGLCGFVEIRVFQKLNPRACLTAWPETPGSGTSEKGWLYAFSLLPESFTDTQ
jgi:hypothetical protein